MGSHVLVTSLVEFVRVWFGFPGCCTSLQYGTPRTERLGRQCPVVRTRRITYVDTVVKLAFDGFHWRSLLQSCYTVELSIGVAR